MGKQLSSAILMVRPKHFNYNKETAANNSFQQHLPHLTSEQVADQAIQEFNALVKTFRDAGIQVEVVEDTDQPETPDAVFPNNWVSFHEDGTVITYPMWSVVRRKERRDDLLEGLKQRFVISRRIAYEAYEEQNMMLESTGSMVLDRVNKIAYACHSERTHPEVLQKFCNDMGYTPMLFHAVQRVNGQPGPIYHTNVMMSVGENFAVLCEESIPDQEELKRVKERLEATGHEIITITANQCSRFAGNMLQVKNQEGQSFLAMSSQAYQSLNAEQVEAINRYTRIIHGPVTTIETLGGGSVRCMMAEIFLPEQPVNN